MSSISIALAAWLMMHSAARTRVDAGAPLVHHHFAERGDSRTRHLLQSRSGLSECSASSRAESLLNSGSFCHRSNVAVPIPTARAASHGSGASTAQPLPPSCG
jgi:hypothetical protein